MAEFTHVDGPEASAVARGHVLVERLDGVGAGHLTVLLVHVVGAGTRVVADPDTEVLDLERVLLVDLLPISASPVPPPHIPSSIPTHLVQADDLTVGLLDLAQLGEEVPETGLGDDIVGSKDAHAVQLGSWVGVRGQVAPNDLVFDETSAHFGDLKTCRGLISERASKTGRALRSRSILSFIQIFNQNSLLFQPMTVVYRVSRGCGWRANTYLSEIAMLADGERGNLYGNGTHCCCWRWLVQRRGVGRELIIENWVGARITSAISWRELLPNSSSSPPHFSFVVLYHRSHHNNGRAVRRLRYGALGSIWS